jgi:hypothetical protein
MSLYRLPVFLGPLEAQPPPPRRAPSRWGRFFLGDCLPTSATLQWPHAPLEKTIIQAYSNFLELPKQEISEENPAVSDPRPDAPPGKA